MKRSRQTSGRIRTDGETRRIRSNHDRHARTSRERRPARAAAVLSPGSPVLLGAIAAASAGVPLVGYFARHPQEAGRIGCRSGAVDDFHVDETRLVTFDNPLRQPWDGVVVAHRRVRAQRRDDDDRQDKFLVLAVNCAHLGCPVSWFPQSGLFMCPAMAACITPTASGPRARRRAACFTASGGCSDGQLEIQAPHYPTLQDTLDQTT